jgi:hypothetical protein
MKRHLEPLATAANITQALFCCLDQVLLTFGFLVMQYTAMTWSDLAEDHTGCDAIIKSIELWWAKADQEVFIAAVILNPFFQTTPFNPLPFLNNAGIHALLHRLWICFYEAQPPSMFHEQITDYLRSQGLFHNLKGHCELKKIEADWAVGLLYSKKKIALIHP